MRITQPPLSPDAAPLTPVFTSKYGKLLSYFELVPEGHIFDLPNAGFGLLFYGAALIHDRIPGISHSFAAYSMAAAAVGAAATSVYLGWVLTTQLQDFCIVCASTYVVNLIMLMMAVQQVMTIQQASLPKQKSA